MVSLLVLDMFKIDSVKGAHGCADHVGRVVKVSSLYSTKMRMVALIILVSVRAYDSATVSSCEGLKFIW